MTWLETVHTAYDAIRVRRMRSALTMLGILIGIAAVMLTVGLGQGAQAQVASQIDALGSNLLIVTPGSATAVGGIRGGRGSATTLTAADAAVLADERVAPDIAAVAPVSQSSQSVVANGQNWTTSIIGTTPQWPVVRARSTTRGRFFTAAELSAGAPVAVIGATTAEQLFGLRSPVGQTLTVGGAQLTVVGELNAAGSTVGGDQDDEVVIPMTTFAADLTSGAPSISSIYLQAVDQQDLSAAYQEATNTMLTSHGVTATTADFQVGSQAALVQTATSTARTLTVLLAGIAAISLLVGGIGVMNIMLVSVTERIREIGLRKALGATPRVILRQFLTEASLLGLAGGVLGVGLGVVGALTLPQVLGQPVTLSVTAALGALVVSLVIGIAAGVYPAGRAARLAPIDALRSE